MDHAQLRTAVDSLLSQHWHEAQTLRGWWQAMADRGLAFVSWPKGCGGLGLSVAEAKVVLKHLGAAGVFGPPPGLGTLMGGPVVCEFGTAAQQQRLLPPLANGTEGWCQLFSEPEAGSDLAGVRTRAEQDGDEWIINGQKVWTSGANHSRRGMLIARTNWDVPKHRGITYFIIDLDQPGVEIRPLKQMNGRAHFSEVFFDNARVSDADRVADLNGGWAVAVATLGYERSGLAAVHAPGLLRVSSGEPAGFLDRSVLALIDQTIADEDEGAPGRFENLRAHKKDLRSTDRLGLVDVWMNERLAEVSAARARTGAPTASLAKLAWTNGLRHASQLGTELLGPYGMLSGEDAPDGGAHTTFVLSVPSASIAGGSDEIQRNIIAERVLNLPKDISVDTDIAFRDARKSGS